MPAEETLELSVKNALSAFEALKSDITPKLAKLDALDESKFAKIDEAIAKAVEASQKEAGLRAALEAKHTATEAQVKALETALSRPGLGGTSEEKSKDLKLKFKKALNEFARHNAGNQQQFFDDYVGQKYADDAELKALSVGVDPAGGYLVQPEMGGIIQTKVYESSPLRSLATVQVIGTDSFEHIIDNDEAASGWVGESGSRSTTGTPVLGKLLIPAHELYANPKATQKILDDASIDMEGWLAGKVAEKFARDEATAFVSGDGVAKPRGFLTHTAGTTIASGQIEQVASGHATAQTYDGLVDLQNALKEPYQANARFLYRRASNAAILKIKDGEGRPIFNMTYDKNAGLEPTIMGKPVSFAADMPAIQAAALAFAYGDFKKAYLIVDRMGIRVLRDPYTDKPYIAFYTTKRVGGHVINYEAIKIGKVSAS